MTTTDDAPLGDLQDAYSSYTLHNPKSHEEHKKTCDYLPGGNTRSSLNATPFPLTFTSGHGKELTSLDGDTYTDFLGEYSAGIFGHSNPRIAETVKLTMAKGWNFGGLTTYERVLAQSVCERFGMDMVRFTNSGTEANTMALAAALAFVQTKAVDVTKRKIMVFSNGYHGGTLAFPMTLVMEARRREEELKNDKGDTHDQGAKVQQPLLTTNLPHDFVFAPYNNIPETKAIVDALPPSSLAAILVEPVQGSGGCRPASVEFLKYLRQVADTHSALLVVDEVMTSRLEPSGICAKWDIKPDLMTLGKWIGGGMSFGAFGGRRDVMEQFDPAASGKLSHAGTFNNNVLSMAAGAVGLDICSPARVEELSLLGTGMRQNIETLLVRNGLLLERDEDNNIEIDTFDGSTQASVAKGPTRMFVTGYGSLINVRFQGINSESWQALFFHHMLQEKIYIAARGYMALTIELTQSDIDNFVNSVEKFVNLYSRDLKS